MKKITLFYDGAWYTLKWLKTMLWAKEEFRELGYEVSFLNEEEYRLSRNKVETFENCALNYEYDIVFIAHHNSHIGFGTIDYEKLADLMGKLKRRCNKIVWCDTSDSTGTLWTEVFPLVDLYLKKQVLIDLEEYTKKMWGHRLYTQYYHDKDCINMDNVSESIPISEKDINKIRVSWNVGLGELFEEKEISYKNPFNIFTPECVMPNQERKYDIQYKGTLDYSICGYQRLKSTELIEISGLNHPDVLKKIPYPLYLQEIAESKAVISPYGWGEICTRDFETFLQGATLIKPDMSHLSTYPNWYIENQTYLPIKWDFSDFMEIVKKTKNSKECIEIAKNAQKLFQHHRTTKLGRHEFAEHIIKELER